MLTHFKLTKTFQYTFFPTCHPPAAKKSFVKGEALRLLRIKSSNKTFQNITTFKKHLMERGYPRNSFNSTISEVKFQKRTKALLRWNKTVKRILAYVTHWYHPAVSNLKEILPRNWYLIQQQSLLNQIFKQPAMISLKKGLYSKTFL